MTVLISLASAGKGKIAKSTKEQDYRAIFDSLVEDLLAVLYQPEWPAAACLLGIVTRYLVSKQRFIDYVHHSFCNR